MELWPSWSRQWTENPGDTSLKRVSTTDIEFYGYYSDYDWVVFCSLFGRMIDLPDGFPMYCRDLKQMFDERALKLSSIEATKITCPSCTHDMYSYLEKTTNGRYKIDVLKTHVGYPSQTNEHNALADAKWNRELYMFLDSLEQKTNADI